MNSQQSYNILLLGDGGVGKTSFVRKLQGMCFEPRYFETKGVNIKVAEINTNVGPIIINIFDIAGQERYFIEDKIKYTLNGGTSSLNIIMYDVTSNTSYTHATGFWTEMAKRFGGPILMVGNKSDIKNTKNISNEHIISCKSKYNINKFINIIIPKINNIQERIHILQIPNSSTLSCNTYTSLSAIFVTIISILYHINTHDKSSNMMTE